MNRDPITINGKEWVYDARTRTHRPAEAANRDNAARQTTDLELPARSEPVATGKSAALNTRVDITVIHYRSRLADPDGISIKAAIDGLVMCGILKDDSTKEIREIRQQQIKVKNSDEEKTEIIIEAI